MPARVSAAGAWGRGRTAGRPAAASPAMCPAPSRPPPARRRPAWGRDTAPTASSRGRAGEEDWTRHVDEWLDILVPRERGSQVFSRIQHSCVICVWNSIHHIDSSFQFFKRVNTPNWHFRNLYSHLLITMVTNKALCHQMLTFFHHKLELHGLLSIWTCFHFPPVFPTCFHFPPVFPNHEDWRSEGN